MCSPGRRLASRFSTASSAWSGCNWSKSIREPSVSGYQRAATAQVDQHHATVTTRPQRDPSPADHRPPGVALAAAVHGVTSAGRPSLLRIRLASGGRVDGSRDLDPGAPRCFTRVGIHRFGYSPNMCTLIDPSRIASTTAPWPADPPASPGEPSNPVPGDPQPVPTEPAPNPDRPTPVDPAPLPVP